LQAELRNKKTATKNRALAINYQALLVKHLGFVANNVCLFGQVVKHYITSGICVAMFSKTSKTFYSLFQAKDA